MDQISKNPVLVILAFIAIYVIWGSTYLLNKIAVTELDPFMLAAIRFLYLVALYLSLQKYQGGL